jgi:lysophospholipase L1-like esterase
LAFFVCAALGSVEPDWAALGWYRSENARVGLPTSAEKRVVFFGDSITELWVPTAPAFFEGRPYLARGVGGQTTAQMLVRFRQDVIALQPQAVVILAGTNDIAGNTGPYRQEDSFGNLQSMVELAMAHGIHVVLASILPARDYPWSPGCEPARKIIALNALLRAYAEKNGLVYLDYHAAMADAGGGLKASLGEDGVHPNRAGYDLMGPLAERALKKALGVR